MLGLASLALVAGWVGWRARQSRTETELALGRVRASRAGVEAEWRRATERIAAAERERVETRQSKAATVAPAGAAAGKPGAPAPLRTVSDLIANDPKAEVLMLRWQRAIVTVSHGPFFRTGALSPEQVRQFEDNWVKRTERDIDLRAAGRAQDEARETVASLRKQADEEYLAAQRQLLGEDGYAQLKEFERTVVVRNVVVLGLAGAASLAGTPVTAQQGEQLWAAALEAAGGNRQLGGEALVRAIDWDALDARARVILTPEQFALFQNGSAPSGFSARWQYQLDNALVRARQEETAGGRAGG